MDNATKNNTQRIAFVWQNSSHGEVFSAWNDGLREAMRLVEKEFEVAYYEPFDDFEADLILYWEAPCTAIGKNAPYYNRIRYMDVPKALLFAGGAIQEEWLDGFDLFFVESKINEAEFAQLGLPYMRAFGVNEKIMRPMNLPELYDGILQATFAGWKRHELFAEALGNRGLAVGRVQEHDRNGYNKCLEKNVHILDKQPYEDVAYLINQSHAVVNTAEFWGGGQRCTLEGMACGVPVVVMEDSPKNREFVEESGAGIVVPPEPKAIREAVKEIKSWTKKQKMRGVDYVFSKWTSRHYADALLEGINKLL